MAWKAYLDRIADPPVPNDTADVDIRYEDAATSRVIRRTYNLTAGQFQTQADFRDFIAGERQKLNRFDSVKAVLVSLVGGEIT
jgi:hypothetical protein